MVVIFSLCLALAVLSVVFAQNQPEPPTEKLATPKEEPKKEPPLPQICLKDGSLIVGEIKMDTVKVTTAYGVLTVPRNEVVRIKIGEDDDEVKTMKFTIKGRVEIEEFEITTKGGVLKVPKKDVKSIVFDGTEVGGNTQPVAVIETDFGKIVFRFYFSDAPKHCENFITLAKKGFYNNLTFHRIVRGFVIQGGCPKGDGTGDPGYKIKAEFNSRKHVLGAVAMARAQDPDSAGCQFYICLTDQPNLDGKYTVFGQVIEGIDVVKKIGEVPVGRNDRPNTPVVMKKITIEERKVPK